MASFGVTDLEDAFVGRVEEAGFLDDGGVEGFDAGLVEGENDPFGGKKVLEESIVRAGWAVGCVHDGAGDVGGEGCVTAGVAAVD